MSIVRNHDTGYNLAVGEPFFLRAIVEPLIYPAVAKLNNLSYPLFKGSGRLLEELKWLYPGKHVVVTNGAKQALLAACYALIRERAKQRKEQHYWAADARRLFHRKPYWVTYPTIAELSHLTFRDTDWHPEDPHTLRVTTSPNNPDGTVEVDSRCWDIWDAAYASPVYGWDGIIPHHKISVWSASKLYGLSGLRVGWLVTGDEYLAQAAAEYVEKTTSGVAVPCQEVMADVLAKGRENHAALIDAGAKARRQLFENASSLIRATPLVEKYEGFPLNKRGMFAWVKVQEPAEFEAILAKAQVKVVDGIHCGGDKGWYRISLGQTPKVMESACDALHRAWRDG